MRRGKKILAASLAGAALFMAILTGLAHLSSRLTGMKTVIRGLESRISEAIDAHVTLEEVEVSFFPLPHIRIQNARLSIPGKFEFHTQVLTVHPELYSLIKGAFRPQKIRFHRPTATVTFSTGSSPRQQVAGTLEAMRDHVLAVLGSLWEGPAGMRIILESGRLDLLSGGNEPIRLWAINGHIVRPRSDFNIYLSCRSQLWEALNFNGEIKKNVFSGRGNIDVTGLHLQWRSGGPFSDWIENPALTTADVSIRLETDAFRSLNAVVEATSATVTGNHGEAPIRLKAKQITGMVSLTAERSVFNLLSLDMENPKLSAAGKLETGPAGSWSREPARYEITVTDADISAVRESLSVFADRLPLVGSVGRVVRGGRVPTVTITGESERPSRLWSDSRILVSGHITRGRIHIPGLGLDIEEVDGDVVIDEGVLQASALRATSGRATGKNGRLTLVFEKNTVLYDVEIDAEADLAPLPVLLKRWIHRPGFAAEMDRLSHVTGRAQGKLTVTGGPAFSRTVVDVTDLAVAADYERLPYPVEITGGRFFWDADGVAVRNLKGRMGGTTFADLSARIDWTREINLEIVSGSAELRADQLHPWLAGFPHLKAYRERIQSLSGTIGVDELHLSGPLFDPGRWLAESRGFLSGLSVSSDRLPAPLHIRTGVFHGNQSGDGNTLAFSDLDATLADSPLRGSGTLKKGPDGTDQGEIQLEGTLEKNLLMWLSERASVPKWLLLPTPVAVSPSRLAWQSDRRADLNARFRVAGGPAVGLDIHRSPGEIRIRELAITDEESSVEASATIAPDGFRGTFSGFLTDETLGRLLAGYPPSHGGWILGDFSVGWTAARPWNLSLSGSVDGENIRFPAGGAARLELCRFSLTGGGRLLTIGEAELVWGEDHLTVDGDVDLSATPWTVNLTVWTDDLNWHRLRENAPVLAEGRAAGDPPSGAVMVKGHVDLRADRFTVPPFFWNDVQADISVDEQGLDIAVARGYLCGIDTPGSLHIYGGAVDLNLQLSAQQAPLEPTIDCLRTGRVLATGQFSLTGGLASHGAPASVREKLKGSIEFNAEAGRIFRHIPLARLLSYLNVIDLFRTGLPDLSQDGFPYRSIRIRGAFNGGRFTIEEGLIDSPTLEIGFQGQVDLIHDTLSLDLLVAPLQTANYLIRKVPVVKEIMGGSLISIPLEMKGDLDNPTVSALPLKMVGGGLIGIIERTLKLPVLLVEPLWASPDPSENRAPPGK